MIVGDGDYEEAKKSLSLFEQLGACIGNTPWVIESLFDIQRVRNISPLVAQNFSSYTIS